MTMKYVIILTDGMSDYKIDELSGKTPMEYANKPQMDELAKDSEVFLVQTVPENLKPGSDVANLSVMGYDPNEFYTGRSPLEAANMGVSLSDDDTAFRANLVTLKGEGNYESLLMHDYSADEISTREAAEIINTISGELATEDIQFYPGVSYRHLMVIRGGAKHYKLTPPHDISDKPVAEYLPDNPVIMDIMRKSREILKRHPVNIKRRENGQNTADSLWIWGEGKRPALPDFKEKFGLRGAVISAVDLIRGIGRLSGMDVIEVEGATGNINTNFEGKAGAALEALRDGCDFVYVHLEAPDECGHRGEIQNKVRSIELIDSKVLKVIKEGLDKGGEPYRIMILPDHPTPLKLKTHVGDPVPCLLYDSRKKVKGVPFFTEGLSQGKVFAPGYKLMSYFLEKEGFCE